MSHYDELIEDAFDDVSRVQCNSCGAFNWRYAPCACQDNEASLRARVKNLEAIRDLQRSRIVKLEQEVERKNEAIADFARELTKVDKLCAEKDATIKALKAAADEAIDHVGSYNSTEREAEAHVMIYEALKGEAR